MKYLPIDDYLLSLISRFHKLVRTEEDIKELERFYNYLKYYLN